MGLPLDSFGLLLFFLIELFGLMLTSEKCDDNLCQVVKQWQLFFWNMVELVVVQTFAAIYTRMVWNAQYRMQ